MFESGAFPRPGNTNEPPSPSPSAFASLRISTARGASGTRCSRFAFILSAGIVHVLASRSTSAQVAP